MCFFFKRQNLLKMLKKIKFTLSKSAKFGIKHQIRSKIATHPNNKYGNRARPSQAKLLILSRQTPPSSSASAKSSRNSLTHSADCNSASCAASGQSRSCRSSSTRSRAGFQPSARRSAAPGQSSRGRRSASGNRRGCFAPVRLVFD